MKPPPCVQLQQSQTLTSCPYVRLLRADMPLVCLTERIQRLMQHGGLLQRDSYQWGFIAASTASSYSDLPLTHLQWVVIRAAFIESLACCT